VPQFIEKAPAGMTLVNDGRIFTPFVGQNPTIVQPGIWGGANWPPSSYDPVQQRLFVCASSVVNGYVGGGDPTVTLPVAGDSYNGGRITFTALARTGVVAALDVKTNTLAWRVRWPDQCYSGTLATAGGLLFVGHGDGRLTALDSNSGTQLWEFQTGAGMHAPVSTFEHKGKQYVLAYSAGSALLGSPRGDSVWLFGVDGTLPPATPGTGVPRSTAIPGPPAPVASIANTATAPRMADANLTAGKQVFEQACALCHGSDGKGGHGAGPSLQAAKDLSVVLQTITAGRNSMPSFASSLTRDQIRDAGAYVVRSLAGSDSQ
jgi:mono/diheme cytochrome c family protein